MSVAQPAVATRRVVLTFLPLAAMWMMMAFEQPLTNAVIGRLADVERNLAAFGIAFSLCIFVQGPAVQLLIAGTALSGSRGSYGRLLAFVNRLVAGLTVLHLAVGATPLFGLLTGRLMGVPEDLLAPARTAFLIMTPWHASVGYRRLWQGVLVRHGRPGLVAVTTLVRLFVVLVISGLALALTALPGATVGAIAVVTGMMASAATTRVLAGAVLRDLPFHVEGEVPLSGRDFARFYAPLVLTALITVIARPLTTAALARGPMAVDSLAAWPVVSSWLFLLQGPALAVQETTVALYDRGGTGRAIRRFAAVVAGVLLLVAGLLALPGPADFCFRVLFDLPAELASLCAVPFAIMVPTVALTAAVSLLRGMLVRERTTSDIPLGVAVNVSVLSLCLFGIPRLLPWPGVVAAAAAVTLAVAGESLFLALRSARAQA